SRRRHTSFSRDWSSDVCSSDLRHLSTPPTTPYATPKAGVCAGRVRSTVDDVAIKIRRSREAGLVGRIIPRGGVDALAQFLARLEVRHLFSRHHHFLAGFRIATNAR